MNSQQILKDLLVVDIEYLANIAWGARSNSYSPYSKYKVGSAILVENTVTREPLTYTGANVENSSYGLTICAERVAIFNYIMTNPKNKVIRCLALATDTPEYHTPPCGACLQVMSEFMSRDALVIHYNGVDIISWTFDELLPNMVPEKFKQNLLDKQK